MGVVFSNVRPVDSVVQFLLHQGFNVDVVSLTVNTGGLAVGVNLFGKLGIFTGGVWKNSIAADTYTVGTTILGVILLNDPILVAKNANDVITKVPILVRGPAMVHDDGLDYTSHNKTTTQAILMAAGIKVVDETGLAYNPIQG